MSVVRFGIVGLGDFGMRYARALARMHGVEVIGGTDLDGSRANASGLRILDLASLAGEADVVVVTTPEHAHRDAAITALEAGAHVVVEKPMAIEDDDAAAMIETSERTGRMLLPAMLLRFDYRYAQIRQRLGEIAPVHNIYAWRNFDRRLFDIYNRTHSLIENAIHDIDLITWYVGRPALRAHGFTRTTLGLANPDVNWGVVEFEGGAIAVVQTSWLYPPQEHANLQWNAGIQVMGARGVLDCANDAGGLRANTDDAGILLLDQTGWADIHDEPRGAFGAMLRHIVAVARGETAWAGTTPAEARESMRIARMMIADAEARG